MTHLDDVAIELLIADELTDADRTATTGHLALCTTCRTRVDEAHTLERDVFQRLSTLDRPMQLADVRVVVERARRRGPTAALRRAAVIVGMTAGVVGLAWAARAWPGWSSRRTGGTVRHAPTAVRPPNSDSVGISVLPGRAFEIQFADDVPRGSVRIALTDGAEIVVRAARGTARFVSSSSVLRIVDTQDGATYDVRVPRGAASVVVQAGARRLYVKDGARIVVTGASEAAGVVRIPLDEPGRERERDIRK